MESYANVFDEEWENLRAMFCCDQDADHGLNLETLSVLWPSTNESNSSNSCLVDDKFLLYPSDIDLKPNSSTVSLQYPSHDIYQFYPSNTQTSSNSNCNNSLLAQVFSDDAMEEILGLKQDVVGKGKMENSVGRLVAIADLGKETPLKRKYETLELPNVMEDEANDEKINKNPKKKTRVSRDNKNKKNLPPNKNQNNVEESNKSNEKIITINNNGRGNAQSSSSCSSEDDSNASQDFNGGLVNLNGKTRASRGAATDPQSLYARKRRERINERLRILQNLVPNGTKVDISTMLEEAVQYVKFLQLQIKLLSSDDMWMYAPIAYNGMDMGLYQNISPTK